MTDDTSKAEAPEGGFPLPPAPTFTETIPSMPGAISGVASAFAPFIYFDGIPFANVGEGVAMLTLTSTRYAASLPGQAPPPDHVITAHLRCSLAALKRLRGVIDDLMLHVSVPAPSDANGSPGRAN